MRYTMLELQQLSRHFGGVKALDQLSFEVRAGDIHGLIGPNGSGKSTTVNLISGVYRPTSGLVKFKGKDL
ncbi:MAG: ATP-binding cassette domain-containing protein, partial [Betaproteobacteria bacterium]|nr:ATP-binding cassette domain-containing protein [Betaproteobacteria bacterium]